MLAKVSNPDVIHLLEEAVRNVAVTREQVSTLSMIVCIML